MTFTYFHFLPFPSTRRHALFRICKLSKIYFPHTLIGFILEYVLSVMLLNYDSERNHRRRIHLKLKNKQTLQTKATLNYHLHQNVGYAFSLIISCGLFVTFFLGQIHCLNIYIVEEFSENSVIRIIPNFSQYINSSRPNDTYLRW